MSAVEYRYTLTRDLREPLLPEPCPLRRRVLWVMLNPSTATETEPDHTITKCIGFTKRWGWPALHVLNLFAMRATEPTDLYKALRTGVNGIGRENDLHFREASTWGGEQLVVCAWGRVPNMPGIRSRIAHVKEMLKFHRLHALGYTKDSIAAKGEPRHPLMLAYETPLQVYRQSLAGGAVCIRCRRPVLVVDSLWGVNGVDGVCSSCRAAA